MGAKRLTGALTGVALAVTLAATLAAPPGAKGDTAVPTPQVLPDFTYNDVSGKSVAFSSLKGKAYVIDLWATWCEPCKKEIPDFIALEHKYKGQGLVLVGISMDDDGAKVVKPFVEANHMDYNILIGDTDSITKVVGDITVLPDTYFVDGKYRIHKMLSGYHDAAEIEKNIQEILAAR